MGMVIAFIFGMNTKTNILSVLSKIELLSSLKLAVVREREATSTVLEHLGEIERRRLFAEAGYSSLHEFVVSELKYSDAGAARRIGAMRLSVQLPEVKHAIDSGSLTLSNAALVQNVVKNAKKQKVVLPVPLLTLAQTAMNCSSRDAERKLRTFLPDVVSTPDRVRAKDADHSVMTVTVSNTLDEKLSKLRARHAHKMGAASLGELLEFAVDAALTEKQPRKVNATATVSAPASELQYRSEKKLTNRYIGVQLKRVATAKAQGACQFVSGITGKRCNSSFALEYDHKKPLSQGGSTSAENLQLLCRTHNQWKGTKVLAPPFRV